MTLLSAATASSDDLWENRIHVFKYKHAFLAPCYFYHLKMIGYVIQRLTHREGDDTV